MGWKNGTKLIKEITLETRGRRTLKLFAGSIAPRPTVFYLPCESATASLLTPLDDLRNDVILFAGSLLHQLGT
jgi:hypothetical protein